MEQIERLQISEVAELEGCGKGEIKLAMTWRIA
jgi:hypothetical protein